MVGGRGGYGFHSFNRMSRCVKWLMNQCREPARVARPVSRSGVVELVTGAASARRGFAQDATGQQIGDVAQGSVRGALGDRRPLSIGELALEAIEKPAD